MLLDSLKTRFMTNEPIFLSEIMDMYPEFSRNYILTLIFKEEKKGGIKRFDNGIYYLPEKSDDIESLMSVEKVARKKYISYKDDIYGIYCGFSLKRLFLIPVQSTNIIEIISNYETSPCRRIVINQRHIILQKPRCKIDKTNAHAYAILQLFWETKRSILTNTKTKESVLKYIVEHNVKESDLLALIHLFPARTMQNLICCGILPENAKIEQTKD